MIRTITIEREFGAGGAAIAEKPATQLGWKLWGRNLTAEIARPAEEDPAAIERFDERCDSLFSRLMKVYMRGSFERSLPVTGLENFGGGHMAAFLQRVLERAAGLGNGVTVGRGSTCLLKHRTGAFHVFSDAPWEEKTRRVNNSRVGDEHGEAAPHTAEDGR